MKTWEKQVDSRVFVIGYFGGIQEFILIDGQRKFIGCWDMMY